MFKVKCNNLVAPVEFLTFPGGEEHVQVTNPTCTRPGHIHVEAYLKSAADVLRLMLLTDALRRMAESSAHFILDIPYLPYARQDRAANKGEALSVKVMCDLINSMKYDVVTVHDCHSDVGLALLDNVIHIDQIMCLARTEVFRALDAGSTILVAPDAGAQKKAHKIMSHFHLAGMIEGRKQRDTQTGEINGVAISTEVDYTNKDLLIVDDICDGGRTFVELAKLLRTAGAPRSISLYVTHGIFSKGKEVFDGLIDSIYARHDWTIINP